MKQKDLSHKCSLARSRFESFQNHENSSHHNCPHYALVIPFLLQLHYILLYLPRQIMQYARLTKHMIKFSDIVLLVIFSSLCRISFKKILIATYLNYYFSIQKYYNNILLSGRYYLIFLSYRSDIFVNKVIKHIAYTAVDAKVLL